MPKKSFQLTSTKDKEWNVQVAELQKRYTADRMSGVKKSWITTRTQVVYYHETKIDWWKRFYRECVENAAIAATLRTKRIEAEKRSKASIEMVKVAQQRVNAARKECERIRVAIIQAEVNQQLADINTTNTDVNKDTIEATIVDIPVNQNLVYWINNNKIE